MRKKKTVTIESEGRDKGKLFVLTEMPAAKAEGLALKIILLLTKSGINIPQNLEDLGVAGLASYGLELLSYIKYDDLEPIIDEVWKCVQIQGSNGVTRKLIEDDESGDIEEISTRFFLKKEVISLHLNF